MRRMAALGVCFVAAGGLARGGGPPASTPRVHIVAIENAPIPGGKGSYNEFDVPVMTQSGRVVFNADIISEVSPASNAALYRGFPRVIHELMRGADLVGGSTAGLRVSSFSEDPAVNAGGEITLRSVVSGPGVVSANDSAVLRVGPSGPGATVVVREGQSIGGLLVGSLARNINNTGENTISATGLIPFAEALGGAPALLFANGGVAFKAARQGDAGAGGVFTSFSDPSSNAMGEFAALVETNESGVADSIVRFDSSGAWTVVAAAGQAAPGGGTFAHFDDGRVPLNAAGDVAFTAELGGTSSEDGAYVAGRGGLRAIAINGSTYDNGPGTLMSFRPRVALNDSGRVVFGALVFGSIDIAGSEEGLFLGDGLSLVAIARAGGPAPGGGVFETVYSQFTINSVGQVLFRARIDRDPSSSLDDLVVALLLRETNGALTQVYLSGHEFEEGFGEVTDIQIAATGYRGEVIFADADALNDRGEAAFLVSFGIANNAIATYSLPCDADLNGDGLVNNADLAVLLGSWGPFPSDADLNGDGHTDAFDLPYLLGAWIDGCP